MACGRAIIRVELEQTLEDRSAATIRVTLCLQFINGMDRGGAIIQVGVKLNEMGPLFESPPGPLLKSGLMHLFRYGHPPDHKWET